MKQVSLLYEVEDWLDRSGSRRLERFATFFIRLVQDSTKDPMDKKTNLQYLDIKFSKLEKTEMITYLNRLLTSYQIYAHKTIDGWNERAGAGLPPAGVMAF